MVATRVPSVHLPYTAHDCKVHHLACDDGRRTRSEAQLGAGEPPSTPGAWQCDAKNANNCSRGGASLGSGAGSSSGSSLATAASKADCGTTTALGPALAIRGAVRRVSSAVSYALRWTAAGQSLSAASQNVDNDGAAGRGMSATVTKGRQVPKLPSLGPDDGKLAVREAIDVEQRLNELQSHVETLSREHNQIMAASKQALNRMEGGEPTVTLEGECCDATNRNEPVSSKRLLEAEKTVEVMEKNDWEDMKVKRLQDEADDLRQQLVAANSTIRRLERERDELQTKLEGAQREYSVLLDKYKEQNLDRKRVISEKMSELGDQGVRLQAEIRRIEGEMESMKAERSGRDRGSNNNNDGGPVTKCAQCSACHGSAKAEYCESCRRCWDESHNREVQRLQQIVGELERQYSDVMRSYASALLENKRIAASELEKDSRLSQLQQDRRAQQQKADDKLKQKVRLQHGPRSQSKPGQRNASNVGKPNHP